MFITQLPSFNSRFPWRSCCAVVHADPHDHHGVACAQEAGQHSQVLLRRHPRGLRRVGLLHEGHWSQDWEHPLLKRSVKNVDKWMVDLPTVFSKYLTLYYILSFNFCFETFQLISIFHHWSIDLGEELTCLAWDGRTVVVGGGSGSLSLWDMERGQPLARIAQCHDGPITALHVSNCGNYIITGGEDRRVVVWTTKDIREKW